MIASASSSNRVRPFGRYTRPSWPVRHPLIAGLLIMIAAGLYGFSFSYYGGVDQPAPYLAPIGVMTLSILWIMPEIDNPPVEWMNRLFACMMVALMVWPDYLALSLPGLPWISALRLFGGPMMAILVISAFGSPRFRTRMLELLSGDRVIALGVVIFMLIAGISVGISRHVGASAGRYFVAVMAWLSVFMVAVHFFVIPGNVRRFAKFLTVAVFLSMAIALYEARFSALPWKNRIPWFLDVGAANIDMLMQGTARAATGIYRVQSKFSTSLGLGEFFGLALPPILYLTMTTRSTLFRLLIFASLPLMFYVVLRTDSRLAFVSFLSSLVIFVLFAAVDRWRTRKDSLFAPTIVLAYPFFVAALGLLSLFWKRLSNLVWGGGAQSFSNASREVQMHIALPKIAHNPLGYGMGEGAGVVGYIAPGTDFVTIDSYFLSVALDYGVLGFIVFYGTFLWAIGRAGVTAFQSRDPEVVFLAPCAISLINFLISKSIYSQQENHPLAFALLGMVVALLYRHRQQRRASAATSQIEARRSGPIR